jgi:hypothetical protein
MRASKVLLLVVVLCLLALCVPRTSASMMDMPVRLWYLLAHLQAAFHSWNLFFPPYAQDDPVSGEMVMSTAYNFDLKNGQRLRFATAETLQQFETDPSTGLGEVRMVEKTTAGEDAMTSAKLCPVCGMETSAYGGPQVLMQHGGQSIHACSLFHAHQVHDEIRSFRTVSQEAVEATDAPFCTGPGTSMLNGFAFFQAGRAPSACILLWFPGWVLNTPWRYFLGCLTVVLCAMMNEYLLKIRRVLRRESNAARRLLAPEHGGDLSEASKLLQPRTFSATSSSAKSASLLVKWFRGLSSNVQHMVHCVLHGATILLAYMLMLVSMTYDGVLFLCCIAGYIAGYFVFGERREAVPDADALSFVSA